MRQAVLAVYKHGGWEKQYTYKEAMTWVVFNAAPKHYEVLSGLLRYYFSVEFVPEQPSTVSLGNWEYIIYTAGGETYLQCRNWGGAE